MTRYQTYQGNQVDGAGPLGLVLLTYEAFYTSLGRARVAIQAGDMSAEANHTGRAMEALVELSTNLNMEEGGQVAGGLAKLYAYMMNKLTEGLCSGSTESIDETMNLVQELRAGWMQLSVQQQEQQHATRPKLRAVAG